MKTQLEEWVSEESLTCHLIETTRVRARALGHLDTLNDF